MSGSTPVPPPPPPSVGGAGRRAPGATPASSPDDAATTVQPAASPWARPAPTVALPAQRAASPQRSSGYAPTAAPTQVSPMRAQAPQSHSPQPTFRATERVPFGSAPAPTATVPAAPRTATTQRVGATPAGVAPTGTPQASTGQASPGQGAPRQAPPGGRRPSSARTGLGPRWIAFIVIDALLVLTAIILLVGALSGGPDAAGAPDPGASASTPAGTDEAATKDTPVVIEGESFRSPSGNILCEISDQGARCGIATLASEPEAVEGCDGTVGYVAVVTADGADTPCTASADQPSAAPENVPELAYEKKKTSGDFECTSTESGLGCTNTKTGAGFNVARAGITTF